MMLKTLRSVFQDTQIKPSPRLNNIFNGDSSYKSHLNPELGLISVIQNSQNTPGLKC